jgi:hypothetical protein
VISGPRITRQKPSAARYAALDVGRLDDIIERNKNPKTSFRKPAGSEKRAKSVADQPADAAPAAKAEAAVDPAVAEILASHGPEKPGARLDKIVARNKKPNTNFRWLKVGLAGIVMFVALILLLFTDLADPPEDHRPLSPPAAKPSGVDGVKLWRAPVKKAGSGSAPSSVVKP